MPRAKRDAEKVVCFYLPEPVKHMMRIRIAEENTTQQDWIVKTIENALELVEDSTPQTVVVDTQTEATILKAVKGEKLADVELALLADALNLDQRKLTQSRDKNNGHKHNGSPCHS